MQLDVKPIPKGGLDCLECLIATMASHWQRGFAFMFIQDMLLEYKREESAGLAGRISCGAERSLDNLRKYHGLEYCEYRDHSVSEAVEAILEKLSEGAAVSVEMLSEKLYWDPNYGKPGDDTHLFLVTGYDERMRTFRCTDSFYNQYNVDLSVEALQSGYRSWGIVRVVGEEQPDLREKLMTALFSQRSGRSTGLSLPEQIRQFAQDIDELDIAAELGPKPDQAALVGRMYTISRLYKQNGAMVREAADASTASAAGAPHKLMDAIGTQWGMVGAMLIKRYNEPENVPLREALQKRIHQIADMEHELYEAIVIFQNMPDMRSTVPPSPASPASPAFGSGNEEWPRTVFIPLVDHYNNHGIRKPEDRAEANLTGSGQAMLADGFPSGSELRCEGMAFLLPPLRPDSYDNLSCRKQFIAIEPGIYRRLNLLAFSEWGDASETMSVVYRDGQAKDIPLEITDWVKSPNYGERIAWEGAFGEYRDNGFEPLPYVCYLFAMQYTLDRDAETVGVQLPYCPNLHLFAISLTGPSRDA